MTHFKETQSFNPGRTSMTRMASSVVEDSHETSTAIDGRKEEVTRIKTAEGEIDIHGDYYNGGPSSLDGHHQTAIISQKSVDLDQFNLRDEVVADVIIQIVKEDLPVSNRNVEDNEISHAENSVKSVKPDAIHYLPTGKVAIPIDEQWHFVKEFITSDSQFRELDVFSKEHFLQKMLRALISQEWAQQ